MSDLFVLEEVNLAGEWSRDMRVSGLTLCTIVFRVSTLDMWMWEVYIKRSRATLERGLYTTADAAKAEADAWLREFAEGLVASLDDGAS